MLPQDIYIDLGTNNTLIYARKKGLILNEPSLVIENSKGRKKKTFCGRQAFRMLGKTPENYHHVFPLEKGVIQDFEKTAVMLFHFLKKIKNEMIWSRSRILISLPFSVSTQERQLFRDICFETGAGIVHLINEPVAGAIGAGIDIKKSGCHMVVDFGGGVTEAMIISRGKVITAEALRFGGNDLSTEITEHLVRSHRFFVGEQTVERVKAHVATLGRQSNDSSFLEVAGIDLQSGLPRKRKITNTMILPVIEKHFHKVICLISRSLDQCSDQGLEDVSKKGLTIFGGSSLIKGLPQYLSAQLHLPVHKAYNPLIAVTIGGAKVLDASDQYEDILEDY